MALMNSHAAATRCGSCVRMTSTLPPSASERDSPKVGISMAPISNSVAPGQREMRLDEAAMNAQLPERNLFSALLCSPAGMMPSSTRLFQYSATSSACASL